MADVMAPGEPVQRLIDAIREGRSADVQVLVESAPALAAARDISGVSALMLALYHGRRDIARWIASRRTDLDVFEAAALGDAGRVRVLVSPDPSLAYAWSPDGFTALGLAAFFGQLAAVRELLSAGADVNAVGRNPGRYTPLTGAVAGGHADVVRELLQHGADAGYRYHLGYTPLHEAASSGSYEIAEMLLRAGAQRDARTENGRTPADFAREKGHAAIVDLLGAS